MSYSADTFVADEQPTTAKWNKLWTNDASFNDGSGIADNAILTRHITAANVLSAKLGLSSAYSGGVASQANAGSAGGTMYYINLGGIKMVWGKTAALSVSGAAPASTTYRITFPTSFFTTLQSAVISAAQGTATSTQYIYAAPITEASTTQWDFAVVTSNGSNGQTSTAGYFVIGT